MKGQFRIDDTVARWGGDEFVAIVPGPASEAYARGERIRHWALGDYRITVEEKTVTVPVQASIGMVAWNGSETGQELFARVDKEMYRDKDTARQLA